MKSEKYESPEMIVEEIVVEQFFAQSGAGNSEDSAGGENWGNWN